MEPVRVCERYPSKIGARYNLHHMQALMVGSASRRTEVLPTVIGQQGLERPRRSVHHKQDASGAHARTQQL